MEYEFLDVIRDMDGRYSSKRVIAFLLLVILGYVAIVEQDVEMVRTLGWFMVAALGITMPDRFALKK